MRRVLSKHKPTLVKVVAVSGAVSVGAFLWRKTRGEEGQSRPAIQPFLPPAFADALAGALGEIAQISILYPLDTIKVRCQAARMTSGDQIRALLSDGINFALVKKLYAGAFGAAACAIVVGAVHLASYEASRRYLLQQAADSASESAPASASLDRGFGTISSDIRQAAPLGGTACTAGSADTEEHGLSSTDRMAANIGAAVFAALVTSLVESPVELFRHNQQASNTVVAGGFLREMMVTVRAEGPSGLYWGFLPHLFEAWPHDVTELLVVGVLSDFRADSRNRTAQHHSLMRGVPDQAWDMTVGAASGAAAVLVSMPFDCVKTFMQTHGTDLTGKGFIGSARLFIAIGHSMLSQHGVGSLYYGVIPRLFQQVPAAMLCWWTMRNTQRHLLPYIDWGTRDSSSLHAVHGST